MEESKDCNVDIDIDVLFRRRRKRRKIFGEGEYLFSGGKENQRRKRRKIFGEDLPRILRSLSFGLETFANFWRVSVSVLENLVSEKVSVLVSENLVSEKKYRFRCRRILSRIKRIGFGFVLEKKSRYRFRSKFWYRHSVTPIIIGKHFKVLISETMSQPSISNPHIRNKPPQEQLSSYLKQCLSHHYISHPHIRNNNVSATPRAAILISETMSQPPLYQPSSYPKQCVSQP